MMVLEFTRRVRVRFNSTAFGFAQPSLVIQRNESSLRRIGMIHSDSSGEFEPRHLFQEQPFLTVFPDDAGLPIARDFVFEDLTNQR